MHINITNPHITIKESLAVEIKEYVDKNVRKYFDNAISADINFRKQKNGICVTILVNEGIKYGIKIKGDAEGVEVQECLHSAMDKVSKQLRRYKRKIKNYKRTKNNTTNDYNKSLDGVKYILPSALEMFNEKTEDENITPEQDKISVISEKSADIESLTVSEAIMKMDLADLPALVFTNLENNRINVIYTRKDGNISWIDPQNQS